MGYFCPKNTFLQLKHYIQKIYLTLLSTTCLKIHQMTYAIFETISLLLYTTPLYFLAQKLNTFYKSSSSKCKFSDFPVLALIFPKFLMSFFKQKVSLSSKFGSFFSVMRDLFCTFSAETLYALDKSSTTSKCKFSDLPLLALKLTKFLMSFLEPRVSFSSNFASLFSFMRHNSSVLFHLNICILWTNGSNQSANFWTFNCSHKN